MAPFGPISISETGHEECLAVRVGGRDGRPQFRRRLPIATGDPVMAIGGFNGSDPTPTLAQFVDLAGVDYIGGGGGLESGSGSSGGDIATWVSQHFAEVTIDGVTIYDLTAPSS